MALGMFLREQVDVILSTDDAIKDPASYEAYAASGYDERKLVLDGEPTRFTLRRMSADQFKRSDDLGGPFAVTTAQLASRDQIDFIVRCSLAAVKNYRVWTSASESGELRLGPEDFEQSRDFDRPMVKAEWLKRVNLPPALLRLLASISRFRLSEADVPFASA